jgi:ATP/maltotriose-dependent transcriptional regulator MalT
MQPKKTSSPDDIDLNLGSPQLKELLLRRARERSSALRWNGYTLVVAYSLLAAIMLLELRQTGTMVIAGVAVAGLGAILLLGRIQARKAEAQSLRDELRIYSELLAKQDTKRESPVETQDTTIPCPLTDRELQVLSLIAQGKSNKETAVELEISDQTVKNHISHIFGKLTVSDRTSAVLSAIKQGWIKER